MGLGASKCEDQMRTRRVGVLDVRAHRRQGASSVYPVAILLSGNKRAARVVASANQVDDGGGGCVGLHDIARHAGAIAHSFAAIGVKRLGANGAGVTNHDAGRDRGRGQVDAIVDSHR